MNGWEVLALILLGLFLLAQIPVGVQGEYTTQGLRVRARLGPVRITVSPFKEKKPDKKKKRSPGKKKTREVGAGTASGRGGAVEPLWKLLPLALEAAGQLRRKLRVDLLRLEVTAGAADPADAAMIYGRTNAALGAAWGPLNKAFSIQDGRAGVKIDFDSTETTVYGAATLSIRVGQALWLGLYFGARALNTVRKLHRQRQNDGKAV